MRVCFFFFFFFLGGGGGRGGVTLQAFHNVRQSNQYQLLP